MPRVVLVGAGGHASVVAESVEREGKSHLLGFLDRDFERRGEIKGSWPILGSDDLLTRASEFNIDRFVLAIGGHESTELRSQLFQRFILLGIEAAVVLDPSAIISPSCSIGAGTVVLARAVINAGASIGENCIVNTGAIVEHDCQIGDHCQISPGAVIAGGVTFGDGVFVGANATVLPGCRIGSGAVIGAGALVNRDVAANSIVFGVPAHDRQGDKGASRATMVAATELSGAKSGLETSDDGSAGLARIDVFVNGDGGFAHIRIPSVVVTNPGTVLAFAESRDSMRFDQGQNKIVLRRSFDHGETWSAMTVIADMGDSALNNPCAVVERESGRIILMFQSLPPHLKADSYQIETGYVGPSIQRSYVIVSDDDGSSWSVPSDITTDVKRPIRATTICSGPGIGIQITSGKYKSRLVFPFSEGPFFQWNNYAVFSDDAGESWNLGSNVPGVLIEIEPTVVRSQVNEPQVVERSDGSILLNSRQFAGAAVRKSAISRDGGETWSRLEDVPDLFDGSCMGSVLRTKDPTTGNQILLYSGPRDRRREDGAVHFSPDDGKSWSSGRQLVPDWFAYSCLVELANGQIGCLFEGAAWQKIQFVRFDLPWALEND